MKKRMMLTDLKPLDKKRAEKLHAHFLKAGKLISFKDYAKKNT